MGLHVSTITQKLMTNYGLPKGVYIKEVAIDSPAMEAGLQSGDVVTRINGVEIANVTNYRDTLYGLTPDHTYEVTVKRKGVSEYKTLTYKVTIGVLK